jgi:RES domain-containing protein
MVLWRISRHNDLSGMGGFRASGRWHRLGEPVVYLAQTPAAALLEVCVHTSANDVPPEYTLLKVVGPDSPLTVIYLKDLPQDWKARIETTQELGTQWLQKKASVLLRVPSAIVPETENFLFNPLHPDGAQFHIQKSYVYPFDPGLKA